MKQSLLFLLTLLTSFKLYAQEGEALNLPKVIPPSPEVSALLNFQFAKVDEYTGAGSFSIPITTVAKGSIQVPVSLGYQSTGLQVDQVASRVGFGWSLNAGGVVARTILGGADEVDVRNYFGQVLANSSLFLPSGEPNYGFTCSDRWTEDSDFLVLNDLASGKMEAEPDMYNYSLPNGQSGKFLFDRNRLLRKIESDEVKIINPYATNIAPTNEWTIIDTQGNTYTFSGLESSMSVDGCSGTNSSSPNVYTAWQLTQITSANGEDIVYFDYETEYQIYQSGESDLAYEYALVSGDGQHPDARKQDKSCPQWLYLHTPVLTKIRTNWGQEVHFTRSQTPRLDLGGQTYPLERISIFQNSTKLKEFELSQSYFQAQSNGVNSTGNDEKNYRLRLDNLKEIGTNDAQMPPYVFHYHDNGNFPARLSKAQDYWGFYNGEEDNTSLITLYGEEMEGIIFSDRFPRKEFAQEGVLSSISYPNGGSVEYQFELNDIPNDEQKYQRTREEEYLQLATVGETTVNFTINSPTGTSTVLANFENTYIPPSSPPDNPNNPDQGFDDPDGNLASQQDVEIVVYGNGIFPEHFYANQTHRSISLPNGSYTAKIKITDANRVSGMCKLWLDWYSYGGIPTNWPIGGLRIAKEINHDGLGNQLATAYQYVESEGSTTSSGQHFQDFRFSYTELANDGYYTAAGNACVVNNQWMYKVRQSSSIQSLGIGNGGHIGYSRVEKMQVSVNNNNAPLGKTVSHFYNEREIKSIAWDPNVGSNPYPKPDYFSISQLADIKNGKLIKQEVFENHATAGLRIKQEDIFEYDEFSPEKRVYSMKARHYETSGCQDCARYKFECAGYWHTVESRYLLKSETSRTYDANGKVLESKKTYAYDPVKTYLKQSTTYGSSNETMTVINTYPHDLIDSNPICAEMVARNLGASPVEVEVLKNGIFLNRQRTEFAHYDNNILPETVYTTRAGESEEPRIQFYGYDIKGNPLEFSKTDDQHVAIFWDADKRKPLAQVMNASHNQVWHTSFETDGDDSYGAWTGNKTKNNPVISVSGLAAGNYTLSFWRKNNGTWGLEEMTFNTSDGSYSTTILGLVDEVRIHPSDARMNTVAYDEIGRVLTECDANGHVVRYQYDDFGRLLSVKDEKGNVLKAYDYHYHNE